MGFSKQQYWSGLPCRSLGNLPNPGIKPASPVSPALQRYSSGNQKACVAGALRGGGKGPGGKTEEISKVGPVWTLEITFIMT